PGERYGGRVSAVSSCDVVERVEHLETLRGEESFDRTTAGATLGVGLGAVLAGEEAAGERLVGEDGHPVLLGDVGEFLLIATSHEGVLGLERDRLGEAVLLRDAEPFVDGLRGEVGPRE